MRELAGIPMGGVAAVLTAALVVSLGAVAVLALRNRVFLRLGVRNLGRRRARTALIVSGLMLGTTIIAAALATGDTMSRTIRSTTIGSLGQIDETVSAEGAQAQSRLESPAGTVRSAYFPRAVEGRVRRALGGAPVDGVAPAIIESIALHAPRTGQSEPRVGLLASDPARLAGFGAIGSHAGGEVSLADLGPGEIYLTTAAAKDLDARAGDAVRVLAGSRSAAVRVRDVVDYDGTGAEDGAVLLALPAAQRLLDRPGRINRVLISNRGGAIEGAALSDPVLSALRPAVSGLGLQAAPVKRDAISAADEAGSAFLSFFTTFGSFSLAAGVLLIFLIFVMLASERRGELGIARALGTRRGHLVQMFLFEGAAYDVLAAAVGALLGVAVAYAMVLVIADAFAGTSSLDIAFSVTPRSILVAYAIGVLLTLAVVTASARRVSTMNIVTAIRGLPEPPARPRRRRLALPLAGLLAGAAITASGVDARNAVSFDVGAAFVLLSLVALARLLGVSDRLARSVGGALLIAWFILPMGDWLVGDMTMDFSVFVVAGLMVVVGATWLITYNAESLLHGSWRVIGRVPAVAPVLKMATAHPLRSLFRTGVTIAMFTLVVLTLVVGATISGAFVNAFDDLGTFGGGFDVRVTTSPTTPIADMREVLRRPIGVSPADVTAVGSQSVVPVDARQTGTPAGYESYLARGLDRSFLDHTTYGFAAIAHGYAGPRQVWRALRDRPGLAVVDALAAPRRSNFTFGSFSDFRLSGFFIEDQTFDPLTVVVRDPAGGTALRLTVIGVLADTAPAEMAGLWTSQTTLARRFGDRAVPTLHLLALRPGVDATATAKRLESALLANGAQAQALRDVLHDAVAATRTFNRLLQGFMALGLVVGVAALGVVTARSVVERRQQIGVLRAIGFRRRMVEASFLLESSLIALTAIIMGTALGLAIAYTVIRDSQQQPSWASLSFDVPWASLGLIFLAVYIVAMATTLIPARRAARIEPARALRYE